MEPMKRKFTIVQGAVSPDEYIVFKPTLKKGFESIIERNPAKKTGR